MNDFNSDIGSWDVSKVTDFDSTFRHAAAFNAQWVRRWLEPGHQPWKLVVDYTG